MSAMLNAKKKANQVSCTLPLLKLAFLLCDESPELRSTDRIVTDAEVTDALSNHEIPDKEFPEYT